jgi:hypothetical protein
MSKRPCPRLIALGPAKRLTQGAEMMGLTEIGSPFKRTAG